MPTTMRLAFEGESAMKRRIDAKNKDIAKIARRPSKRQRMLESKMAEPISGRDKMLYKGEDLKRRPR